MDDVLTCDICRTKFMSNEPFVFSDHTVYTCPLCKTRFTPSFTKTDTIYDVSYVERSPEYFNSVSTDYIRNRNLLKYIRVSGKRILDIGCGAGIFLNTLKDANDVLGIEISAVFEPYLKKRGIPYIIGNVEEALGALPDESYDLISLWDVFEHLEHPREVLALIRRKLSADGVIINWTNNYDDFISGCAEFLYRASGGAFYKILEKSFKRVGGHHYNFIPAGLERLYKEFGFDILETIITDTPVNRITASVPFSLVLRCFYGLNMLAGKGKIVCHVLRKRQNEK